MEFNLKKTSKYIKLILFIILFFFTSFLIHKYGLVSLREKSNEIGFPIYLILFILRGTSIVLPALPSTGYSILAGLLLGFPRAYPLICISDLISCSISFYLSKKYGKKFISKITTQSLVLKIENFSKKYLENNYLLITAFLMTGFFDFVCYALGLTKTTWKRFLPSLIISILLSNAPIIAFGSGLLDDGKRILIISIVGLLIMSYLNKKLKLKKILG
tara:strand:+ start:404 stop:1054 length:651 start_codon:yes stop_codon:yes gene_type:complete